MTHHGQGPPSGRKGGNAGSLMRILPAAYVLHQKYGRDVTLSGKAMEDVHKLSALTHRHPLAQSACGIYYGMAGIPDRWLRQLAGTEIIEDCCQKLEHRFGASSFMTENSAFTRYGI